MPRPILTILIACATLAAAGAPAAGATAAARPDSIVAADSLAWRLVPAAVVASSGDGRGQVVEPSGVVADAFGRLVITDAALHRLQRFDPAGRWLGTSGSLGSDPGQLRRPGAVVMLGALAVAVLDRENRRIESYDLFGRRLGTIVDLNDETLLDRVGRIEPVTLAADRGGALYLADSERDRVLAFDFAGQYLRTIGGFGARPGSFRGLGGLAVSPDGGLVTAERVNARVQRLDAGGRVTVSWALPASRLPGAMPVAVDDSGRVAVGDEAAGKVWLFDPSGRPLAALAGLARPRALAFAPDGTMLIAEAAGTVRRFTLLRASPAPRGD